MSDEVIILGGGFAGLACGVALADAGRRVTLLEKKPHLGGRAYSFKDQETGDVVDNGQHLFMGCYRRTRAFLRKIGTEDRLSLLEDIRVDFAEEGGRRDALRCPSWLGSPLHLAAGVLGLRGVALADKLNLRKLDAYVRRVRGGGALPPDLDRVTVRQWMDSLGQSRRIQERLFDPIALGALNDKPEVAAATGFVQVLREAFYTDVESTRLGVANVGLSELYAHAAARFIEDRGGKVLLNSKVKAIQEGRVITEDGQTYNGTVVSTLPPWNLKTLELPARLRGHWENLKAAPIVSLQLWLSRPILTEPFVGLLGTEIQWAFNKSRLLSLDGEGQCSLSSSAARTSTWPATRRPCSSWPAATWHAAFRNSKKLQSSAGRSSRSRSRRCRRRRVPTRCGRRSASPPRAWCWRAIGRGRPAGDDRERGVERPEGGRADLGRGEAC